MYNLYECAYEYRCMATPNNSCNKYMYARIFLP